MTIVERAVLKTLAYFEQFKRALTIQDLHQLLWDKQVFFSAIEQSVTNLVTKELLEHSNGLYAFNLKTIKATLDRQSILNRQRQAALKMSGIMQQIPGVRSVLLMNSVAMQTSTAKSDIDFLIITQKQKLYSARMLTLSALKWRRMNKTLVRQAGKSCLGYWLSEDCLSVKKYQSEPHTAAYWIATMVPLVGYSGYQDFIVANTWVKEYLPNWQAHQVAHLPQDPVKNLFLPVALEKTIFHISKFKILTDPEFRNSSEMVCTPEVLKLHSVDKRPGYGQKMQSILDILPEQH